MLKKRICRAILDKLDILSENTVCNSEFLGILLSHSALSFLEKQEFEALHRHGLNYNAAKQFYQLVIRNKIPERLFLQALKETCQTGAIQILQQFTSNIWFDVQRPISSFVGRQDELAKLENLHQSNDQESGSITVIAQVSSLTGIGGIGKTELCRQYLSNFKDKPVNILWLNADNEGTITTSFKRLAKRLDIQVFTHDGEERDINAIIREIFQDLEETECIFVYDNCDEPALLQNRRYLPKLTDFQYPPKILITSRSNNWPDCRQIIVDRLELEDAVTLVRRELTQEVTQKDCKLLVEILQCFPLAIQQAIAFINQENYNTVVLYTIKNYVEDFNLKTRKLLECDRFQGIDCTYSKTTFTTWKITFDTLLRDKKIDMDSLHMIYVIGYLDPETIHRSMFDTLLDSKEHLDDTLNCFTIYNILSYNQDQETISIHRLLQQVIRLELKEEQMEIDIICKSLQLVRKNEKGMSALHATSVWRHASKYKEILNKFYDNGKYTEKELSPLHLLVQDGNNEAVASIAEWVKYSTDVDSLKDKRVNRLDGYNRTALFIASSLGNADIAEELLKLGADPKIKTTICFSSFDELKINVFDPTGWTPLHVAAYFDRSDVIRLLVKNVPSLVNDQDTRVQTPPLIAVLLGNIGSVIIMKPKNRIYRVCALMTYVVKEFSTISELDKMLKKIKDGDKRLNENLVKHSSWRGLDFTPIRIAAHVKAPPEIFNLLRKHGAKLFRNDGDFLELLKFCATVDNGILAEYIFQNVENPNLRIIDGSWTVLHCAGRNGGTTVIKQIIQRFYVNINVKDRHGDTPLYQAAYIGNLETVKYLVENGANINSVNKIGCTPVIAAAVNYKLDVVNYFVSLENCKIFPWETKEENDTLLGGLGISLLHVLIAYDDLDMVLKILDIKNLRDDILRKQYSQSDDHSPKLTLLHAAALFNSKSCINFLTDRVNTDYSLFEANLNIRECIFQFYNAARNKCFEFEYKNVIDTLINVFRWIPNSIFLINPAQCSSLLGIEINQELNLSTSRNEANFVLRGVIRLIPQATNMIKCLREYSNVQKNSELQAGKELTNLVNMFKRNG